MFVAENRDGDGGLWRGIRDQGTKMGWILDFRSIVRRNNVPPLKLALGRRAVLHDVCNERTRGVGCPKLLREVLIDLLDGDAQPAPHDFAVFDKAVHDRFRHVTWNGESNAHVPARSAKDGGIDSNEFSLEIDQGSA